MASRVEKYYNGPQPTADSAFESLLAAYMKPRRSPLTAGLFVFVLALHKSGSSQLSRLLEEAVEPGCFVDQNNPAFQQLLRSPLAFHKRDSSRRCSTRQILFFRPIEGSDTSAASVLAPPHFLALRALNLTCKAIVQIRNPLDMLVSQFQSFTKTHPMGNLSTEALAYREKEHKRGADAYAITHAPDTFRHLEFALNATETFERQCSATGLLHYEDMVSHGGMWVEQLIQLLSAGHERTQQLPALAQARLRARAEAERELVPDENTHVAFLTPGAYVSHLKPTTILQLNQLVAEHPQIQSDSGYF
mmetsp:Transcript_40632/g.67498  ORF Transcript_40632/g.67498 Transcript_40632/m.67498 type:complete len:305 (-) Transcript_40632:671-1585(-)|eukprot:CAMPEP_0119322942 /NCGR_PEP_ID=MMETSP1333-20130426/59557_1 /TAXON_ID=418940 /ORGANISM="Scyphosphaera apsteinii, Strain RCC1455" /LENGTH=304 /DNA_ID=CAMNT_0007330281 /DNA_START=155 /DNA_END=1069 /DNA_ORIENTATION=+